MELISNLKSAYTANKKAVEFVLKIAAVYIAWKLFSHFFFDAPIFTGFKNKLGVITAHVAYLMLKPFFLQDVSLYPRVVILAGSRGIYVADLCLAIPAMVIFTAFITIYSGKAIHKLWFIPMGLMGIFLINSLRIASLAYIQRYSTVEVFNFTHNYAYVIVVYSFIFLMIKLWMDKFDAAENQA
jgi:exosortase/archaeosortase family protein